MEVLLENILSYFVVAVIIGFIFFYYLRRNRQKTETTIKKIEKAKEFGLHEPVSLHPVVDVESCIGSGACIEACPEHDVLGIVNGKATTINASRCVGHGACFHACPVQAITLCIGTEKRGVELPHISQEFETNIKGLYIAGELGGMGLIKNAVEQGKQAIVYISKKLQTLPSATYDVIIVGAGPAGISASLMAEKLKLKFKTIEQDSLGGTVFSFPRSKIVMTSPMDLTLHGKVKLGETNKSELLALWQNVLNKNKIKIHEHEKVESIQRMDGTFELITNKKSYSTRTVLLAIGRRGSPRKLGVIGEEKEKVFYRLLEPELIQNKKILVVGGGDSAVESALIIANEGNEVTLSYRGDAFSRLKPKNLEMINEANKLQKINTILNSNVKEIKDHSVILTLPFENKEIEIDNDLVYIFAGGELPTVFLEKVGIRITKKYGDALLKHIS
ncbi:MAG: NAD(P)-binding domain-containing protein [Ignavibacteriaceae bacterium]|nr:NAD(P)-binding domain-containing protein [Ignavibacteriaceae bacterium]